MRRAAGLTLERGMQRIASAKEFRCIDAVIRVEAEAACWMARWSVLRATRLPRAVSEMVSLAMGGP